MQSIQHVQGMVPCGLKAPAKMVVVRSASYAELTQSVRAMAEAAPKHLPSLTLTPREKEIVELVAEEMMTNRDIAKKLDISEETVKRHLSNIFDKVGVSTRLELAVCTQARRYEAAIGDQHKVPLLLQEIATLKAELAACYRTVDIAERVLAREDVLPDLLVKIQQLEQQINEQQTEIVNMNVAMSLANKIISEMNGVK